MITDIIDKLRVRMWNFIANEHEKIDDNNEKWGKHDKTNEYVTMKDTDLGSDVKVRLNKWK